MGILEIGVLQRARFRTRLMLGIGCCVVVCGFALTAYLNALATAMLTDATEVALQAAARSVAQSLANNMAEREREIFGLSRSAVVTRGRYGDPALRRELEERTRYSRDYVWIGLADRRGIVQAATGGLLEGVDVKDRPWFQNGQSGELVGDVHDALLLEKLISQKESNGPVRFVDFIAPVYDDQGSFRGVLGAHVYLDWVAGAIGQALPEGSDSTGLEVLLLDRQGRVIYPQSMRDQNLPALALAVDKAQPMAWPGQGEYLVGGAAVRSRVVDHLGWRVLVRQPLSKAMAPVERARWKVRLLGLGLTLIFVLLTHRLAVGMSRPLEQLARTADEIASGANEAEFAHGGGSLETVRLADALGRMIHILKVRQAQMADLNSQLEERVRARTMELQTANEELANLARTDLLTGLANRRLASERLHEEFVRMRRSGGSYAVLLLDIDHFKQVNDKSGHLGGDEALKKVAQVLRQAARMSDFVFRFGGEEFLILLPDTDLERAAYVAEKLRIRIEEESILPGHRVTLSAGVGVSSVHDRDDMEVVHRADEALYQAKASGRNRVCVQSLRTDEDSGPLAGRENDVGREGQR